MLFVPIGAIRMTDFIVSGLLKRRAELATEAKRLNDELSKVLSNLDHIDGVIRQFDETKSLRRVRLTKPAPRGDMTKTVLGILRVATAPMTVREIACAVMSEKGWDQNDRKRLNRLVEQVRVTLIRQAGHGSVEGREDGDRKIWRVAN
jgi:hypothetical protein